MRKWKQGDWEIHLDEIGDKAGGWCLRHIGCTVDRYPSDDHGLCSCSLGKCYNCDTQVPDDIQGFFELVKWKR